jgi:putative FmdB family regulatory protein
MARYEYVCDEISCDNYQDIIEIVHPMSENPEIECNVCHSQMTRLLGGQAGIVYKGSGYYTTDSRKINCAADVYGKGCDAPS